MNLDLRRQTQIWLGLYEREIFKWLACLSKGIQTAADIGCSDGFYTSFLLLRSSAERVWSFDPDPRFAKVISENLALNDFKGIERWRFVPRCVGNTAKDHFSLAQLEQSLRPPALLKIDVEGAELSVLQSAMDLLKNNDVRCIVETHSIRLETECLAFFTALGYRTEILRNAWWRTLVPEERPIPHNRWLIAFNDNRAAFPSP